MSAIVIAVAAMGVALVLAYLIHRVADMSSSTFQAAVVHPHEPKPVEPIPSLVVARRAIINATSPRSLYLRTRPVLVELVDARLRIHHGFGLDSPEAAGVVGEPLWSVVRPDAPSPDHDDTALTLADVRVLLDRIESL